MVQGSCHSPTHSPAAAPPSEPASPLTLTYCVAFLQHLHTSPPRPPEPTPPPAPGDGRSGTPLLALQRGKRRPKGTVLGSFSPRTPTPLLVHLILTHSCNYHPELITPNLGLQPRLSLSCICLPDSAPWCLKGTSNSTLQVRTPDLPPNLGFAGISCPSRSPIIPPDEQTGTPVSILAPSTSLCPVSCHFSFCLLSASDLPRCTSSCSLLRSVSHSATTRSGRPVCRPRGSRGEPGVPCSPELVWMASQVRSQLDTIPVTVAGLRPRWWRKTVITGGRETGRWGQTWCPAMRISSLTASVFLSSRRLEARPSWDGVCAGLEASGGGRWQQVTVKHRQGDASSGRYHEFIGIRRPAGTSASEAQSLRCVCVWVGGRMGKGGVAVRPGLASSATRRRGTWECRVLLRCY